MSPESPQRESLPFEPSQKSEKTAKKAAAKKAQSAKKSKKSTQERQSAIPQVVSRRMLRRIAIGAGIPTLLSLISFPSSYWLVDHGIDIPLGLVFGLSLGGLGLGFVGLNYGIFSASWDEDRVGSWFGFEEAQLNWKRIQESRRAAKESRKDSEEKMKQSANSESNQD